MSDRLKWMNKHAVLFLHPEVKQVVEQELYQQSGELEALSARFPSSEDYLSELESQGKFKEACAFLSYNLHHRVAVWWAYLCVLDLMAELKEAPAQERDIADIGKPAPFEIPEWAQMPPPPEPDPELIKQQEQLVLNAQQELEKARSKVDPEIQNLCESVLGIFEDAFRDKYGKTPQDALQEAIGILKENPALMTEDPDSPAFKAERELKEKIEKMRQETIETIKSVLPPIDAAKLEKNRNAALDAVFGYIVSPDEDNAQNCLNAGNAIPDKPEGLLALAAFWSFGNMAPAGAKVVVPCPKGLLGNGINNLLLMCALHNGGTKKLKERYGTYFRLGFDVVIGKNNWADSVEAKIMPHRDPVAFKKLPSQTSDPDAEDAPAESAANYRPEPSVSPAAHFYKPERFKADSSEE